MPKYFNVKVCSRHGPIYQKDFKINLVFGNFVRLLVSELRENNIFMINEKVSARIIPKYDFDYKFNRGFQRETSRKPTAFQDEGGWLSINTDNGIDPEQELKYFTLEICSALRPAGNYLIYTRDFRISELSRFQRNIDTALCTKGLLGESEQTEYLLFARDDDEADFDKEIINAPENDDLILKIDEPDANVKTKKSFKAYNSELVGTYSQQDVRVLISRRCYQSLEDASLNQPNPSLESGGVILGQIFEEAEHGGIMVDIDEFIPAREVRASDASLRFTHETWMAINQRRQSEYPDKATVGWYHTHPFKTVGSAHKGSRLEIFLSHRDAFIHRTFFREPWHLAMVLGYEGKEKGFFQWRDGKIVPCKGFHIYDEENGDE